MKRLGILIVTYNSADVIRASLQSAVGQDAETLVVDNASQDRTLGEVRRWPAVGLIANSANRGFAAAVNQGLAALNCQYVLLLNPDAVIESGLDALVSECSSDGVAAAAGKLVDEHGQPQTGFSVRRFPGPVTLLFEVLGWNRLWPGNPVNRRYRCLELNLELPAEVEQPAGAFLMIRRDVWLALNGLDEEFFPLWFEEVDYLRRAVRQGYSIRYVPSAVARHTGGHSIRKLSDGCRELFWYGSLLRYAAKHFGFVGRKAVCVGVVTGSLLRMVVRLLAERDLHLISVYGRVVRLAFVFLFYGRERDVRGFAATGATGWQRQK